MSDWGAKLMRGQERKAAGQSVDPVERKRKRIEDARKARVKQDRIDAERGTVLVSTLKMRER